MAQYLTRDPDLIRQWAEERGGKPYTVSPTRSEEHPGLIGLAFPDSPNEDHMEEISWGLWFSKFLENDLVLLYQEESDDGRPSHFNRLLEAEAAEALNGEWKGGRANSSAGGDQSSGRPESEGPTAP